MASCVGNICAKNRQNPLILLKVTIDKVGVPFYWDTVYMSNCHVRQLSSNVHNNQ